VGRVRDLTKPATRQWTRKVPLVLDAIKYRESVFALPFAYAGMVLAADGLPTWGQFLWITVAMVAARTLGMSANRLIDRHIDARNPRTAERHLPAGLLGVPDMAILTAASVAVFLVAAAQLNTLALALAPVAGAYLILYPYTKRFTWASNIALGWALAIAPSGAWIGVTGELSLEPAVLSLAVALWAGSFDIIYHVPDRDFHLRDGLHSVAQRFGIATAFRLAGTMDFAATAALVTVGLLADLAWPYYVGCSAAAVVLVYKHRMVSPSDTSRIGVAFFRTNAYVSTAVFAGTLAAVLL
jgi:4-hydroxybenzoate polyprenyltransferase